MRRAAFALALALAACGDAEGAADAGPERDATIADAAADAGLPNLLPDRDRTRIDLAVGRAEFAAEACELDPEEACVGGPGERTLLHFSASAQNLGDGDLVVGAPSSSNPAFQWSECHQHFHLRGFAEYRLVDADGRATVVGRKQAFCLVDSHRVVDEPEVPRQARYGCEHQGIQRGWADVYEARVPCQFLDVTDVAPGDYRLEIELSPGGELPELDRSDNQMSIPVSLGDPALATPTEPCAEVPDAASRGEHRECGWTLAETVTCEPGERLRIGCAPACGLGACTGTPMLRVCDGARADGNCSFPGSLARGAKACGGDCPVADDLPCPASGSLAIYVAPQRVDGAASCEVATVSADSGLPPQPRAKRP